MDSKINRRILLAFAQILSAWFGPRSRDDVGFLRFWICWGVASAMYIWTWFINWAPRRGFLEWMYKLDGAKFFAKVELHGALDEIEKDGSLFGYHPHGALAVGFAWNGIWSKRFREIAGVNTQFCIDKVLREDNPLMKVICDFHGGMATLSKSHLMKMMKERLNIAFIPGGFQDATTMRFGKHSTVMRSRTGFIKYALQHGYRVHPCYTFGESESFYTFNGFEKFRLKLNDYGIPSAVIFGWWLLPLLPRRAPEYHTFVGKPLQLPKIAEPSKNDVEHWHGLYLAELTRVFEENKKSMGVPETEKLTIS